MLIKIYINEEEGGKIGLEQAKEIREFVQKRHQGYEEG